MKLRIRGSTLRLRVSKPELAELVTRGWVEDACRFAPGSTLSYRLEVGTADRFLAEFARDRVRVRAPRAAVTRWARDDEVAMSAEQPLGGGESLAILVEKDFECLKHKAGEDESNLFANPAKHDG